MTKSPTPQPTFFFTATTTTHTSTLSLHDALPILVKLMRQRDHDPVNRAEDLPVVRGDRGRVERAREPPRPAQILVAEYEPLPHPGVVCDRRDVLHAGDRAAPHHRHRWRRGAVRPGNL